MRWTTFAERVGVALGSCRVDLNRRVLDPETQLDADRNVRISEGRIAWRPDVGK